MEASQYFQVTFAQLNRSLFVQFNDNPMIELVGEISKDDLND